MYTRPVFFGTNLEGGDKTAISVVFWQLGKNISPETLARASAKILQEGLYPPEGTQILGWYVCPGGKGVTILESKTLDPAQAFKNWLVWVQEQTGFFESYEVLPGVSAQEAIQMVLAKPKR